ncbi:oligosaccharide flippase family protein [Chengkuizengella marina]|uniref:Polysaccharide biosynthesis protein n=1 Tax=Chengkuizengella marina TaxID=2507566 RepID=A0A6N9Q002_9BACL|nr:oligosaccharide flippase family protein [Chengkuizengella marina]NBI28185.1 polysaccharide biosynthesis protein [Chengkuizengella marina]
MNKIFLSIVLPRIKSITSNDEVKRFISNLGTIFIFRFIAAILNALSLIIVTRYYGVVAIGEITIIQNVAYFLIIPILLGVNLSIIKYIPTLDKNDVQKLLGSVFVWNIFLTGFFVLIYLIFTDFFSGLTNISTTNWIFSVALAVFINLSMVMDAVLRAEKKFFTLGITKLIGTSVFFVIIVISSLKSGNIYLFIGALIINHCIFAILSFKDIEEKRFGFSLKISKLLYGYGAINMVSWTLSTLLFSVDLFIVNHFVSSYDVGIYSAYHVNVRIFFNMMFHEIFAVVFLPTIAQMDKIKIYKRIVRLIPILLPLAIIANAVLCMILLFMYGRDYPFNWLYVLIVSLSTGFHFIYWIFNSVFTVEGKKGAWICLLVQGIPLPVLLGTCYFLTKIYGVTGAMVSSLITQIVLIGMFILLIKVQYFNRNRSMFSLKRKSIERVNSRNL